jgi:hypothetical protein
MSKNKRGESDEGPDHIIQRFHDPEWKRERFLAYLRGKFPREGLVVIRTSDGTFAIQIRPIMESRAGERVPEIGSILMHIFLSGQPLDNQMGDLEERYRDKLRKEGPRVAKVDFYRQVITSIWPHAKTFAVRFSQSLRKMGLLILIEEWIRRRV